MDYLIHLAILICIYAILAQSLNLVFGFTGLFDLGHIAFYGIGAYTSSLLTLTGVNFWLAFLAGGILAAVFGFLLGIPTLKLKGHFLAIATFGFGEIIRAVMLNWTKLTRGPLGLPGIPRPLLFGFKFSTSLSFLILIFAIAVILNFIIYQFMAKPFGRVLKAIREDEIAAQTLGRNTVQYKLIALTMGAFFAGLAGVFYAHYINFIDPSTFVLHEVVLIFLMVIMGGSGNFWGTIMGAALLVLLPEPLRFMQLPSSIVAPMRQIIYALLLIIIVIRYPNGLIGPRLKSSRKTRLATAEELALIEP